MNSAETYQEEYRELKLKLAAEGNTWAMGDLFEEKASELFPEECFSIINYTPRREDIPGRKCENAKNPDFLFRDKRTDEEFWVECKFRSCLSYGRLSLCWKWRLDQYKQIRRESGKKFYFIVGFQGEPQNPKKIYCIDLDKIEYGGIFRKEFIPYEIKSRKFYSLNSIKELMNKRFTQYSLKNNLD